MWSQSDYYVELAAMPESPAWRCAATRVYSVVCRTDLTHPGFMLINLPEVSDSFGLRREMLLMKQYLAEIHHQTTGDLLVYTSLGRFDQQETTKPHRDGGPEQSLLMLGYEPTVVHGRLFLADYTLRAHELGITPQQFLSEHNPMYVAGARMLERYSTPLEGLDPTRHQILLINNSCMPFRQGGSNLLGVLHQAVVENPSADAQRIVNSTMIASVAAETEETVTMAEQERFLTTRRLSPRV